MRKTTLILLATAGVALLTSPASACKVVGYTRGGEPLCMTTSDGPGQQYTDGRWRRAQLERRRESARVAAANSATGGISWLGNKPYVQCLQFMGTWNNPTKAMAEEGRRQCNRKYYGHD